jgi:hypothetical protein
MVLKSGGSADRAPGDFPVDMEAARFLDEADMAVVELISLVGTSRFRLR